MMMFSEQFFEQDSDEIEYKGEKISRYFSFDKKGTFDFKFTFIGTNSKFKQAIVFHLNTFDGNIYYQDKEIKGSKGRFPQVAFPESTAPRCFHIKVILTDGDLCICNGSDRLGIESCWCTLYGGCAMKIKNIESNRYRIYCNDHENDDDFDDLIFEMEIKKKDKTGDG